MTQILAFWALIFQIAHALLTGAVGFYVYLMKRSQVSADRLTAMERSIGTRLDGHDKRLSKVEAACLYAPTHQDLGKIYERINEVSGQVKKLNGGMEGISASVTLIHEHLLNRSGGR